MKAPVGLLSDRTVLRSKMEGLCPDKFRVVELSRVYHTIPQSASKTKEPPIEVDGSCPRVEDGPSGISLLKLLRVSEVLLLEHACSKPCQERVRQTVSCLLSSLFQSFAQ